MRCDIPPQRIWNSHIILHCLWPYWWSFRLKLGFLLNCTGIQNCRWRHVHHRLLEIVLGTVHKYLGGGGWKISILVRENFFDPPLALPKTFLTPLQTYPKLFWPPLPMYPKLFCPPETFWERCCQETWVSDYFCYFDVLSNHWCSQTNLEKTWTESFWYTSTLGHYEEGKGKNLFWRTDGVGAT